MREYTLDKQVRTACAGSYQQFFFDNLYVTHAMVLQLNPNLALCIICTTKMIQYEQHVEEGMWGADELCFIVCFNVS